MRKCDWMGHGTGNVGVNPVALHNKQILLLIDLDVSDVACNLRQGLSKGGKLSCDYKRHGKRKTQHDQPFKAPEITNVSHTFVPVKWRLY
jgi:hypothetical protein